MREEENSGQKGKRMKTRAANIGSKPRNIPRMAKGAQVSFSGFVCIATAVMILFSPNRSDEPSTPSITELAQPQVKTA